VRIAVVGATGNIGARVVSCLEQAGHDVVAISRSNGVDTYTGVGLDAAFAAAEAVVDTSSFTASTDPDETLDFFQTSTANILAAEQRAGVTHHVLLSIVGIDLVDGNAHYGGKRAQEVLIEASSVPFTIVRATQFFDFPLMTVTWMRDGDSAAVSPLLIQPIAPDDVAAILAEAAGGSPLGRIEVAGPEPQDLVDMARRHLTARGETVRLLPTWGGLFGAEMAGDVLLPGDGARITETTFDEWLASDEATG
jgi:uncharacterized protein YbjT (DUF2867 family)